MKKQKLPITIALSAMLLAFAVLPTLAQESPATDAAKNSLETQKVQENKEIEQADLPVLENAVTTATDGSVELVDDDLLDFIIPSAINETAVTAIGDNAFFGCKLFRTVTIPAEITEIGAYAFAECPYLDLIILEGRVDTEGMILGKNWSGEAEVLFEYIVVEEKGSAEAAEDPATVGSQQTSEQEGDAIAETDTKPSEQVPADGEGMDPVPDSDASSEEFKPSDSSMEDKPAEDPSDTKDETPEKNKSEPVAVNKEADTDVPAVPSAEVDTTPASEGEGSSESE